MPTSCARIVPLRQVLIVVLLLTALIPGCKRDSTRPAILEGNIGPSNLALRGRLIFDATPFMARPYAGNFL